MEPEWSDPDKPGDILLDAQIDGEKRIKGKMEPERATLEASLADMGVEVPERPCLLYREM